MRNVPAILLGVVGSAFLAGGLVSGPMPDPLSSGFVSGSAAGEVSIAPAAPSGGFDGRILFGSDSVMNVDYFKALSHPMATLKDERKGQAPEAPGTERHESRDEPARKRQPQTFGCMTSVSPLARASADQNPSLCLAQVVQGRRTG
ncbi:hypothetical protein [Microvirga puerhi]|uniref:Uncharacterized protein n=1 Tax=Microvirga puerhi TaxID=2876078 RepID=A0ABS7VL66_9HYPH|nr:hypothetical protein [Microvirga puerhi]MBZ6076279.1 hypothetical protein [Microvirga puerhi]